MDVKTTRRITVSKPVGGGNHGSNRVCAFWREGRCSKNPCRFLHRELSPQQPKQSCVVYEDPHCVRPKSTWRNPNYHNSNNGAVLVNERAGAGDKSTKETQQKVLTNDVAVSGAKSTLKAQQKLCDHWVKGSCIKGDKCHNLHTWFHGNGFSMLAKLEGHSKAVTGIALPSGSNKLYSVSNDKSVRAWDCHTGQCAGVVNLESEAGILISEGPWVFLGLHDAVKAWNTQTCDEMTLNGPGGLVYAMVVGNEMLFVGTKDGVILAWKSSSETNGLELASLLKGHSRAVLSLVVGAKRLYSGSMDKTIRVWDTETLQCMQTIHGHTDAVMSVICWDSFLLSGSLDKTIKVWAATESGNLDLFYERNEQHGVLVLCGVHDAEAKPIILCSCNDNTVRIYELPSFTERGRIFSKQEVRSIRIGTEGLFFTGDATGLLFVWKLLGESSAVAS